MSLLLVEQAPHLQSFSSTMAPLSSPPSSSSSPSFSPPLPEDGSDEEMSASPSPPAFLSPADVSGTPLLFKPHDAAASSGDFIFVPHAILEDCSQRDSRCAHALRVRHLEDIRFPTTEHGHTYATVLGAHCTMCTSWRLCTHAKSKFNSTHNSKRRVHTLLFWKHMLGVHFPVPDALLQDAVWKNLDSCACGIKRSNGHAKQAGKVCINPNHYKPVDYNAILDALIEALLAMGVFPQHRRIAAVVCLRQAFADPQLTFTMLCEALRSLTPT